MPACTCVAPILAEPEGQVEQQRVAVLVRKEAAEGKTVHVGSWGVRLRFALSRVQAQNVDLSSRGCRLYGIPEPRGHPMGAPENVFHPWDQTLGRVIGIPRDTWDGDLRAGAEGGNVRLNHAFILLLASAWF